MELYITEKPSVARGLVDYFNKNGASFKPMEDKKGYFDANQKIAISWCFGHLVYLEKPSTYDEKWKSWNRSTLPIIPEQFRFKKSVILPNASLIDLSSRAFKRSRFTFAVALHSINTSSTKT